jgi:uncharacterized protein YcaQ
MRAMEFLQLDPLQVVARSQDIALYGRVLDYTPGAWEKPCYEHRKFFDWGGWLAVRPMEELPHWRVIMRRERQESRIIADGELGTKRAREVDQPGLVLHGAPGSKHRRAMEKAIEEMRAVMRAERTVTNRDFAMNTRQRTNNYRGRKDSAVALYYLWRIGELMTHHRERFERVYSAAENIAPAHLLRESSEPEADAFIIRKTISFHGFHRLNGRGSGDIGNPMLSRVLRRPVSGKEVADLREKMLADGDIIPVTIEGMKDTCYVLAEYRKELGELAAGRVPRSWKPLDTTTQDEVTFLSPLDIVTARERAKDLFDFEYKWEVYVPLEKRKYGYYALPILWGDAFVGRCDMKLDRATNTLVVCGIWFESRKIESDPAFIDALAKGITRFMHFVKAEKLDAKAVASRSARKLLSSIGRKISRDLGVN